MIHKKRSIVSKSNNTFIGNFSLSDKEILDSLFKNLFFEYYSEEENPYVISMNGGLSCSRNNINDYIEVIKWALESNLL